MRTHALPATRGRSRGSLLLEAAGALLLLGIIMGLTVELLHAVSNSRRATDRRIWAIAEAQNAMERVSNLPWDALDEAGLAPLKLDEATASRLPSGRLSVAIQAVEGSPRGKKVTVTLLWKNRAGADEAPVRLTTWIYRKGDSS